MIGDIEPKAYRFAYNYCNKYNMPVLDSIIFHSLKCKTEMIEGCLLVQYTEDDNIRVFYSMFFDEELWDRKKSGVIKFRKWLSEKNRKYSCKLPNISSIRLFIGRT
jgi:hypothetical protein